MPSVRSVQSTTSAPSTRADGLDDPVLVRLVAGVDGDVADHAAVVERDQVDVADRAAGLADRGGDAPEHARPVVDPDADGERELGRGGRGHGGRDRYTPRRRAAPPRVSAAMADAPRELFLIDGNSLAYRAFFALPESIATSDGRPTNAIFGFASMLVKILTDHGDVPTVVVWDAGLSGRKEISADYKAQRSSRPTLLKQQWPHLRPLVEAFGYPNVSVEGYEADDVIAALAEQAKAKGIPVMVVTGDRDAYQLVGDGVRIMTTSRGITDTKVYDRQGVVDRYGIAPELIPDFIGLKGDTSDNIPGVPGIGDKTAAELLQRFGSLEDVLANVDQISGAKRKQNLTEHAEDARISKQLATIVRDVPVELDLEGELDREPDRSRLREIFREWELRDPLRRLEEALEAADAAAIPRPETLDRPHGGRPRRRAGATSPRLTGRASSRSSPPRPRSPEGELLPRAERLALRRLRGRAVRAGRRGRGPRAARRRRRATAR